MTSKRREVDARIARRLLKRKSYCGIISVRRDILEAWMPLSAVGGCAFLVCANKLNSHY